ncbi:ferritin-like domain-containing protein [Candidatus Methanomassiliicoccus intestinalis]|jgi:ferritin, dps family protein|uniref:Ferritin, Dps family protein n=2 Tax=Candidatus Methanomassiliicoccus intestinalis TaxID=1406512 RepID=R9T989_METII|nr:ferritin-like domain-containing protein [Candidatus Methanomassiliicoccus intestinalis]AGN26196.1 Ferritin, Dps family protein [Candidatus Methanomassiliicoccus intestinalis Issoire-Mx1]TQS82307.1 MAG: ferritin [Candidatus Methanomassiliicoccus intestinalis]TQS84726.1 MAG: ferritin [Candidatus Methanomassiliicoccus intestinalis]
MTQERNDIKEGAGSEKMKAMLNDAIAGELQVSIQYMWQHVVWKKPEGYTANDEIKRIAIVEMKHAEMIAERLNYLGGIPTTKPYEIVLGGEDIHEQLKQDQEAEERTIKLYNDIIELAVNEHDVTTRHLFERILEEEEEHHDFFTSFLDD